MSDQIHQRLAALGIELPHVPPPVANYVPFTHHNKTITVSGQLPRGSAGLITGCLGDGLPIDQGVEAARLCAIAILAVLNEAVCQDFGQLDGCIQITGFVR